MLPLLDDFLNVRGLLRLLVAECKSDLVCLNAWHFNLCGKFAVLNIEDADTMVHSCG